jgi:glycosyltransferase involved in cell wall biosynthesis
MQSEKATRVLIVVQNCPYSCDPRVRNETETLATAGYRVSVVSPRRSGERWYESMGTVSIYRFPLWSFGNNVWGYLTEYIFAIISIAMLSVLVLCREGFDIIHVANPPDCILPIISFYKLLGKSFIYDQHDLCPELYAAKFGENRFALGLLGALERYSYCLASQVIVTNESCKEVAVGRGHQLETKVTVVRNGPRLPSLNVPKVDADLRAKAANIIAFAGVIGFQDGLNHLCRALHCLRYKLRREDFYCVVLGDGDALDALKALARELNLDDKIWFAGWISDPLLYVRYLSTADICVAPDPSNSYNDQSTFVKIMEYMAAGKPIVAFDLLETRRSAQTAASYARPNDPVDFAQKLLDLMENSSLRSLMGEAGYVRVQKELAWQHSVPKLLSVYEKVAKSALCPRSGFTIKARAEQESER